MRAAHRAAEGLDQTLANLTKNTQKSEKNQYFDTHIMRVEIVVFLRLGKRGRSNDCFVERLVRDRFEMAAGEDAGGGAATTLL